jgi:predicted nuclease of predicted toxin-antitoxin system
MRLKLDENLPAALAQELAQLGHDVDTAIDEGLAGRPDAEVWAGAGGADRVLLTQDLDFSDLRTFVPGTHPGLVLIRLREPGLLALRTRVLSVFRSEATDAWTGCFVVITDKKVRVRRPRST